MGKWVEIRSDYFDEEERCICIDAWETDDDNEEGRTIAKIYEDDNLSIVYIDEDAITDSMAQNIIDDAIHRLESSPDYYKFMY